MTEYIGGGFHNCLQWLGATSEIGYQYLNGAAGLDFTNAVNDGREHRGTAIRQVVSIH